MKITKIFSALVPPGKHGDPEAPERVIGTEVALNGNLYKMLSDVYAKSDEECDVPVYFLMADDGEQRNEVRTELVQLIQKPTAEGAVNLGSRLRDVTNRISGVGLLFFVFGNDEREHKVVLSRFPADEGVLAEVRGSKLDIEFVEQIFIKGQLAYKAALYRGKSFKADFWDGAVVDHQTMPGHSASYWIKDFLRSDFKTTSQFGSRRLAIALRDAAKSAPSLETKREIASAITLLPGLANKKVKPVDVLDQFGLSAEAKEAVLDKFPNEVTRRASFALDAGEFRKHARYRSVELDTGAMLTAPAEDFDRVFQRESLNDGRVRFSATGRVVDEKVKGRA